MNERRIRRSEYWAALAAVCMVSVFYYGIRAAAVMGLAAVTAVLTDFFCLFLQNKAYKAADLSNAAAAVIMTLMFPASIPYSIVLLSTVFAVTVGVHVFGSRGNYLFHPSAVGYLFALLCWKDEVLRFPPAGRMLSLFGNEGLSFQASLSSEFNTEGLLRTDLLDLLIGAVSSPMGTGCILLLFAILVILVCRRSISFWGVWGYIVGIAAVSVLGNVPVIPMCAVNMILFAAIFLAGDTAALPRHPMCALCSTAVTGMLTYFLIDHFQLEYAPVIAVLLSCPVWQAFDALSEQFLSVKERSEYTEIPAPSETEVQA